MKSNPDKFQFIIPGKEGPHTLQINYITIKSSSSVTFLGITADSKLNFVEHNKHDNIVLKTCY